MAHKLWKTVLSAALAGRLFCFLTTVASAEDAIPTWDQVRSALIARAASFQNVNMTFRKEIYNSEKEKTRFLSQVKEPIVLPENGKQLLVTPLDSTPDRVIAFHWVADKSRWLCERTTVYPSEAERPLKDFARYNGELLFRYDDFAQHGAVITATSYPGFFDKIDSNPHLGLLSYVEEIFGSRKDDFKFAFVGKEVINGQQCLSYQGEEQQAVTGQDQFSRITISVSPSSNFTLVKLVDETFLPDANNKTTSNGSAMAYVAQDFEQVRTGLFVPRKSRLEFYRLYQGKLMWRSSEVYIVDSMEINSKLPNGIFDRDFPPGVPVSNDLLSPGVDVVVGGNWHDSVNDVIDGKHPTQEIKDGTAIQVPNFLK